MWWCCGKALDSPSRFMDLTLSAVLSRNDSGQVVHTRDCHQSVLFGTDLSAVMLYAWEGNHRLGRK